MHIDEIVYLSVRLSLLFRYSIQFSSSKYASGVTNEIYSSPSPAYTTEKIRFGDEGIIVIMGDIVTITKWKEDW
jgi:hypothetical protein